MKTTLSLLLLFIFATVSTKAQIGPAEVTQTSVGLYNSENSDIKILLGRDRTSLDTFTIRKQSLWYSGYYDRSPIILIKTGPKIVSYTLGLNNYYLIFFDRKKKHWDLLKTTKQASRPG